MRNVSRKGWSSCRRWRSSCSEFSSSAGQLPLKSPRGLWHAYTCEASQLCRPLFFLKKSAIPKLRLTMILEGEGLMLREYRMSTSQKKQIRRLLLLCLVVQFCTVHWPRRPMRINRTAGTGGDQKKPGLFRDLWVMKGNLDVSLPNEASNSDRRDCLAGDRHHDHSGRSDARAVMIFTITPMGPHHSKISPNSEAAMPGDRRAVCHRRIADKGSKARDTASGLEHAAFQSIAQFLQIRIQSERPNAGGGSNAGWAWPASETFSCGHGRSIQFFFSGMRPRLSAWRQ